MLTSSNTMKLSSSIDRANQWTGLHIGIVPLGSSERRSAFFSASLLGIFYFDYIVRYRKQHKTTLTVEYNLGSSYEIKNLFHTLNQKFISSQPTVSKSSSSFNILFLMQLGKIFSLQDQIADCYEILENALNRIGDFYFFKFYQFSKNLFTNTKNNFQFVCFFSDRRKIIVLSHFYNQSTSIIQQSAANNVDDTDSEIKLEQLQ
ncbi:hypothetical protein BpHYR1_025773 [Brachionus plicatilis]|uniref:Uncharacterized protein n=1 Tax=Brachionus plicatilis TaxID=10195 RepID=A0A3M7RVJ7_BRAPC|nr:hypothetical protein BpHYR1_025773 [Brachionus plicatilis]